MWEVQGVRVQGLGFRGAGSGCGVRVWVLRAWGYRVQVSADGCGCGCVIAFFFPCPPPFSPAPFFPCHPLTQGFTDGVMVVGEHSMAKHPSPAPPPLTQGFTDGVMVVGEYSGRKVSEAKPLIRDSMVAAGQALMYSEPEKQVWVDGWVGGGGTAWWR